VKDSLFSAVDRKNLTRIQVLALMLNEKQVKAKFKKGGELNFQKFLQKDGKY